MTKTFSHAKARRREEIGADIEADAAVVVDCAFKLHRDLGPGLLESVYETVLAASLAKSGLAVERQSPVRFTYDEIVFDDGLRIDLLINHRLVVELKSVEHTAPVHAKQVLTYLRLLDLPLGLLINFGAETFKSGIKRIVNNHTHDFTASPFAPSRLRVSPKEEQTP